MDTEFEGLIQYTSLFIDYYSIILYEFFSLLLVINIAIIIYIFLLVFFQLKYYENICFISSINCLIRCSWIFLFIFAF